MHTFTLVQERNISEINTVVRLYSHDKTGARLLSLVNDDENKAFGITFRTPPVDSTGVAHIMEHSVLCGSRKYPVKELLAELLKGSLKTFLNAFTYPDRTCYPLASQNLKDFYNLIDVYLDTVLYPLIPEHTFQQEGWHYETDSPEAPFTFKGVVFNEMKGAYSSPDNVLEQHSQQAVFPDNTYGLDTGGNPAKIPDLTYDQFKAFHEAYYHPSNAYIYFYGNDPEPERLRLLGERLNAFDKKHVRSEVALQPRFDEPRRVTVPYDSGGAPDAKSYITLNWLWPEGAEAQTALGLSILSHILITTPASPLRKTLIDSRLGEDLVGGGYQDELRQGYFSTGMKGVLPENVDKVEALILDTLAQLGRKGLDKDMIAASLNTIEFRLREMNTGSFPRGLLMMFMALRKWLYGGDPISALAFEAPLNAIKARLASGEPYFENLIKEHFLNNSHRATVILQPDAEEARRRDAAEQSRLARARSAMAAPELERVAQVTRELKERQATPDSPEALAAIPVLTLGDIDRGIKSIPIESLALGGVRTLYHDILTNGIVYLDLGLNLHALPADLLPYAGLFGRLLLETGTERQDFVKLTQRIGRSTGGIWPASMASTAVGATRAETWLFLRGKSTGDKADELLAILQDVLLTARLDNRERFRQIVLEEKAGMEAALVPAGHRVVNTRLRAHLSEADWVREQMSGVSQLFFLRELVDAVEKDWPSVAAKLESVRRLLINRPAMVANVTLDAANWSAFRPRLETFLTALPSGDGRLSAFDVGPSAGFEGLTIPSQVNYVGKGADLYALGYRLHGSSLVIKNYLGMTWLWEKIRMQGGAYGAFSMFDAQSGIFNFVSYRDPNLLQSLDTFDATSKYLHNLDLSGAELTKAIIGAVSELDAYLLPDAKGWTSMTRYLIGYTDAARQQFRDQVLGTTLQDFKAFGQVLAQAAEKGQVVVLGSADAIGKANAERAGLLQVIKVL